MEETKEELMKYLKKLKSNLDFITFLIDNTQLKYCREDYKEEFDFYIFALAYKSDGLGDYGYFLKHSLLEFVSITLEESIIPELPEGTIGCWFTLKDVKRMIKDEIENIEHEYGISDRVNTLVSNYLHVAPRCSGKTTQLVITSNKTQYPIICNSIANKEYIKHIAKENCLPIPEPITLYELDNKTLKKPTHNYPKVLIDDGEIAIKEALNKYYGIDVVAVTVSSKGDLKC